MRAAGSTGVRLDQKLFTGFIDSDAFSLLCKVLLLDSATEGQRGLGTDKGDGSSLSKAFSPSTALTAMITRPAYRRDS